MSPAPGPFVKQGYATADATITTTTETVAATVSGISTDSPDTRVEVRGTVNVTPGTATTQIVVRVRRGTDNTGTIIGDGISVAVTAALPVEVPIAVQDTPGAVAGQSYVVTVQQTAATGNGTIFSAELVAEYPVN